MSDNDVIDLEKDCEILLDKVAPGTTVFRVGLGWDANQYGTGGEYDADLSSGALKTIAGGLTKFVTNKHFVFYGNPASPDGSIIAPKGDNRTGDGAGDDEEIVIDTSKLPAETVEVPILATIHKSQERGQNWGQLNASITLYDHSSGVVLARVNLGKDFSTEDAIHFASLYRDETGKWTFKALKAGYNTGLSTFVNVWKN